MKLKSPSAFWEELDEKRRSEYRIVAAVLLGIFTLFTAVAVGSYFFTWKQDASLLGEADLLKSPAEVSNASSKLGFRWGHFLVTRSFGIAALGIVALLAAWTLSRAVPKWGIRLGKWFAAALTGTFLGSWLLAFIGRLAGWDTVFGAGIGGRAGAALVDSSIDLVGFIVTAVALLALTGLWFYFVTGLPVLARAGETEMWTRTRSWFPNPNRNRNRNPCMCRIRNRNPSRSSNRIPCRCARRRYRSRR